MRNLILTFFYSSLLIPVLAQDGILKVGFDIDDSLLYSEPMFRTAPRDQEGHLDYGWINTRDREYSEWITPTVTLVDFFIAHGHKVYFITARKPDHGGALAAFLEEKFKIPVVVGENLFFSPKETIHGKRYTTKQRVLKMLDLDLYYGDSDTDMIAALKADVHPVRLVRDQHSIQAYGSNYFGNLNKGNTAAAPFNQEDLKRFYRSGVGIFGEAIYPLVWEGPKP